MTNFNEILSAFWFVISPTYSLSSILKPVSSHHLHWNNVFILLVRIYSLECNVFWYVDARTTIQTDIFFSCGLHKDIIQSFSCIFLYVLYPIFYTTCTSNKRSFFSGKKIWFDLFDADVTFFGIGCDILKHYISCEESFGKLPFAQQLRLIDCFISCLLELSTGLILSK